MMVYDYVRFTGDLSILSEHVNGKSLFEILQTVLTFLKNQDHNGNLLPEKPKDSLQDWLDSIPRSGEVFSNEVLYYRALQNMVELAGAHDSQELSQKYASLAKRVHKQLNDVFWNATLGYYRESCFENVCVNRLTNESSLAILYDVSDKEKRDRLFNSLLRLDARAHLKISKENWGTLNAFPLYEGFKPNTYQNGTDWPFLDAMNAGARLKYHNENWEHPLTQWWVYFNANKKKGERLPEFVSPYDKSTGLDQAWSTSPMTSFIRYGFGLDPDMTGSYTLRSSPQGKMTLKNLLVRGKRITISVK